MCNVKTWLLSLVTLSLSLNLIAETNIELNKLVLLEGDFQTQAAGSVLNKPLKVKVTDNKGLPVKGIKVDWQILTGSGKLSHTNSVTDAHGIAQSTLTLGSKPGGNSVKAIISQSSLSVSFTAMATAGSAQKFYDVSGNNQTKSVGSTLDPFRVRITDASNNPIPHTLVLWQIQQGNGSANHGFSETDARGFAELQYTLGKKAGLNKVRAQLKGTDTYVQFQATATAGEAAKVKIVNGSEQSGMVGSTLDKPFEVQVYDEYENLVPGAAVSWLVTKGQGALSSETSQADEDGIARISYRLGKSVGPNVVRATAKNTNTPVEFEVTGLPGKPHSIHIFSGDKQVREVGTALEQALTVVIRDSYNNVVPDSLVNWLMTAGGGMLSDVSTKSNDKGLANVSLVLGNQPGKNSIKATLPGTDAVAVFTATGIPRKQR